MCPGREWIHWLKSEFTWVSGLAVGKPGGRRTQFRDPILLLAYHSLPRLPNSFSTPAILLRSRTNCRLPSRSHLPLRVYRFDLARPAYMLGLGFERVDG